jgi:hypothetical protein
VFFDFGILPMFAPLSRDRPAAVGSLALIRLASTTIGDHIQSVVGIHDLWKITTSPSLPSSSILLESSMSIACHESAIAHARLFGNLRNF